MLELLELLELLEDELELELELDEDELELLCTWARFYPSESSSDQACAKVARRPSSSGNSLITSVFSLRTSSSAFS